MNATTLNFVGSCLMAILILGCTIRIKRQIRESAAQTNPKAFIDGLVQYVASRLKQLKNQGDLLMSTVSTGIADLQAGVGELTVQVAQLQTNQAKASEAIAKEIARVNATIASLGQNPGDAAAIAQALTDLNLATSNLSAVNASLQVGTQLLDAEDPDPAQTQPPADNPPAVEQPPSA